MRSRYNLMTESLTEYDDADLQKFPDPLTADFNDFQFTEPPIQYDVTQRFIDRPYLYTYLAYGAAELEDVVLNVNNIPHISTLEIDADTEHTVSFPTVTDLNNFINSY